MARKVDDIILYEFDDIEEYRQYINTQPRRFITRGSESGDFKFTGTKSYEEAENLLINGYHKGLEKLMQSPLQVSYNEIAELVKRHRRYDYAGNRVSVPRMLSDKPKSMIRNVRNEVQVSVPKIEILYKANLPCKASKDVLFAVGKALMSAIMVMEKNGVQMQLKSLFCIKDAIGTNKFGATIMLKKYSQRLNPLLVAYPLAHPSWFRRHWFRLLEVAPDVSLSIQNTYGWTMLRSELSAFESHNRVLICATDYLQQSPEAIFEDIISKIKKTLC